ncbi:MFS transporter [Crenobacter cavernae]|uniref:MFS transporter n=1 Tax=Crenobacter cavernae TaxID=2290923 RepID=A0ABY0FAD0_9NEIS|nr:MFS transporter [Crenobacter cavernae]RXZ42608.1 MFS transporter [Crenobacter cavernae]
MNPNTSFGFFTKRRFFPLFSTQFLGAFNDNLLKTAIVVLISYHGLSLAGLPPEQLVNLAAGIFILPFFLFSATAGKLSERLDKAAVARVVKQVEIVIMLLAGVGFFLHSAPLLLSSLFLMGVHSTFFGPLKYSVLPQHLGEHELVGGNGLIEMGTFLAILIGQIGGSLMVGGGPWSMAGFTLGTALLGYVASRFMPSAPATNPKLQLSFNVWADSVQLMREAWALREVRSAMLGISWFWLMGAVYTTQLPTFTRLHLGGDAGVYTLGLVLFSIGIGAGSIVCAKLSRGNLELGLVLIGGAGMTVFGADLALSAFARNGHALLSLSDFLADPRHWRSLADIALLGFFGGFFTVPLYTWLQTAAPESFRSQAIAANNILNGFYMVGSAIASAVLLALYDSISILFLAVALTNIAYLVYLTRNSATLRNASASWWRRCGWRG